MHPVLFLHRNSIMAHRNQVIEQAFSNDQIRNGLADGYVSWNKFESQETRRGKSPK